MDHNSPEKKLEEIRKKYELFCQELEMELYLEGSGRKQDVNTSAIYAKYKDLTDKKLIDFVGSELKKYETAPEWSENHEMKRRLRLLREATMQSYFGNLTRELNDKILATEGTGIIKLSTSHEEIAFRESAIIAVNEENRNRRSSISEARDDFIKNTLNPLYQDSFQAINREVHNWGFKSYAAMVEDLSGLDLYGFHTFTEKLLKETEDLYSDVISNWVRKKLGIRVSDLKKHDLSFLSRIHGYDHLFPQKGMVDLILGFVKRMGIDPTRNGSITFDLDSRPCKSPRAFCSTVRIPKEIYVVIAPAGGIDDYEALLHELGHALHFAHTKRNLGWEFKRLGDNSITEAFAFTFDHLVGNRYWLEKVMGFRPPEELIQHLSLVELMMLRRYAAKFSYELVLFDGKPLDGKDDYYQTFLSDATKAQYPAEHYLHDVDPFFYCIRYLRAWILESMISQYLVENFNEDWFHNPRTGEFLIELWSKGQKYNAEELVNELNFPNLTFDFIKDKMESIFS